MVLQELGRKLESAMQKLSAATLVDEEVIHTLRQTTHRHGPRTDTGHGTRIHRHSYRPSPTER